MSKLVVDASAWLEYLDGSSDGQCVKDLITDAELFTSSICLAEVIARMIRRGLSSDVANESLTNLSTIIPIDAQLAREGGKLYAELRKTKPKIALSDAITLAVARKKAAKILTFDTDFQSIPEANLLKKR
ncbi:PIN domain-containing protein [Candidatus Woesearchaeota archaeon]|nr:PIN domain-containing protein [Candidatus Woesearchaeota archaeon]